MSTRERWVDNVKALACALVVLGHFSQSMVKAGIVAPDDVYAWFQMTIYTFHVPLFFICSGYLYQRYTTVDSLDSWWGNVKKKLIVLGVPYVVFTIATLALKVLAGDGANSPASSIFVTLLLDPTAPYWYLYTLFFLFALTPTAQNKRHALLMLLMALALKMGSLFGAVEGLPFFIKSVTSNGIWFAAGICLSSLNMRERLGTNAVKVGTLFLPLSIWAYAFCDSPILEFIIGCLACAFVVSCALNCPCNGHLQGVFDCCARYTMPVYLMHTIFAAGMRVALIRLGVSSSVLHVILGITVSFIGPAMAMIILSHLKPLDFIVYPNLYIASKGNREIESKIDS